MTYSSTRIYRTRRGWVLDQRHPSGGRTTTTYPTGQDAMIALDPRNRPRQPKPTAAVNPFAVLTEAIAAIAVAPVLAVADIINPGIAAKEMRRSFPNLSGHRRAS